MIVLGVSLIAATGVVFVIQARTSAEAGAQPPGRRDASRQGADQGLPVRAGPITVAAGTKITFTNEDSAPHTATSGPSPGADGVFDTGTLKKGQSKGVKVAKAGTFAYYCAIHPFMKGTVIVK